MLKISRQFLWHNVIPVEKYEIPTKISAINRKKNY
jgi:hypothetical protein